MTRSHSKGDVDCIWSIKLSNWLMENISRSQDSVTKLALAQKRETKDVKDANEIIAALRRHEELEYQLSDKSWVPISMGQTKYLLNAMVYPHLVRTAGLTGGIAWALDALEAGESLDVLSPFGAWEGPYEFVGKTHVAFPFWWRSARFRHHTKKVDTDNGEE